jgi:hypothetical protein
MRLSARPNALENLASGEIDMSPADDLSAELYRNSGTRECTAD